MAGEFFKTNWRALFATAVFVIILGGLLSWHTYTSPKTVWNDMLVNNLAARSVTKNQVVSSGTSADVQSVSIQFGPPYAARSLVTVRSEAGGVTTETLATQDAAFLRYADITDATGKKDYSSLVNVWAKAGNDNTGSQLKQVFNKAVLDLSIAPVPPIGYLDAAKRNEIVRYIHQEQVFAPDFAHVKSEVINGREVYTYTVTVKLAPYLRMMQEFARVYGLKDLESISPTEYQSATLKLDISADKLSHQMARVASSTLGLNETYTDYGVIQNLQPPTKTVSISELQKRLASVK
jgi:hypothetical protein